MNDPSPLRIRAPRPGDAARMHEIELACFSDPWPASTFVAICAGEVMSCGVADTGAENAPGVAASVAGYWVGQRIDDEAELTNLAVDPVWRSRRIGRQLLEHFIEAVGGTQRTTIFLEVRASNAPAVALYLHFGFEALDRRRGYYSNPTEDAIVMARRPRALPIGLGRPSPSGERGV
ncbi:MAG: ribosomal protein S18-alanine N-acetyltransferase [Gemmatimonadaceae bacterium]|nr:ribosomal protein S18-alanine N-acetyltransferase [Gemmatimonadaceae bacterium]MCW5825462.1 ribosomal protein S18-alanine N-acetyltransferase [Gemmatimonadaceae bacterium]